MTLALLLVGCANTSGTIDIGDSGATTEADTDTYTDTDSDADGDTDTDTDTDIEEIEREFLFGRWWRWAETNAGEVEVHVGFNDEGRYQWAVFVSDGRPEEGGGEWWYEPNTMEVGSRDCDDEGRYELAIVEEELLDIEPIQDACADRRWVFSGVWHRGGGDDDEPGDDPDNGGGPGNN